MAEPVSADNTMGPTATRAGSPISTTRKRRMFTRFLRILLWTASATAAVAFLIVAIRRMFIATPLDPIEGAILDHALRISNGGPWYVEPVDPAAPVLMPGFPFLVSLLMPTFGTGLWLPRLLSLLAALAAVALVIRIVQAECLDWTLAVASGGLMLAGYALLAGGPGVARPEPIMLLLVLAGYWTLRFTHGFTGVVVAVVVFAAASLTQLTAVWFTAAAGVSQAFDERKRLVAFALGVALVHGGGYAMLSQLWGPWFNDATWNALLRTLQFDPLGLLHYAGDALLGKLGVLTLTIVLSFALPNPAWRARGGIWLYLGIAMVGAGLLATQSTRVGPQALIPTVTVLALIGPLSMQRVMKHLATWPGSTRLAGQGVVLAALALQFFMLLSSLPPSLF